MINVNVTFKEFMVSENETTGAEVAVNQVLLNYEGKAFCGPWQ
jgi:hypothetical protein